MKRAGAGVPSANRITLLRDTDGDGVADLRSTFLDGLNSPFGMALVGNDLYVANTDALLRFPYRDGDTAITAAGDKVVDLPAGPINHHWTKNVIASPDGRKLYVTVGSNSNVAENGIDEEDDRAAIWEVDRDDRRARVFASGLRNPNGLAWEPATGALWTVVNERDELGSDLVPDYLTSVRDGGFYGWPYSYYGQHVDARVAAAAAGPRRQGDRARLRARPAHRVARPRLLRRRAPAGSVRERHVRRPARLVEPRAAQRLQGDLRALRGGKPAGPAGRRADRLRRRRGQCAWAGRSASRSTGRARCSSPTTSAMSSGGFPKARAASETSPDPRRL